MYNERTFGMQGMEKWRLRKALGGDKAHSRMSFAALENVLTRNSTTANLVGVGGAIWAMTTTTTRSLLRPSIYSEHLQRIAARNSVQDLLSGWTDNG